MRKPLTRFSHCGASGKLHAEQVWSFAYEDGGKKYLPRPDRNADLQIKLPYNIWKQKYNIITQIYGFDKEKFRSGNNAERRSVQAFPEMMFENLMENYESIAAL